MSRGSMTIERRSSRRGPVRPASASPPRGEPRPRESRPTGHVRGRHRKSAFTSFVTATALALALVTGFLAGSGFDPSPNSGRSEDSSYGRIVYGTPPVPGHPAGRPSIERRELLRRFVLLDGVN